MLGGICGAQLRVQREDMSFALCHWEDSSKLEIRLKGRATTKPANSVGDLDIQPLPAPGAGESFSFA